MSPASAGSGGEKTSFLALRGFPVSSHGLLTPHLHFLLSQVFDFPSHGSLTPHLHSPFAQVSEFPLQCEFPEHCQYKKRKFTSKLGEP